jgi:NAD(P)-dependent dehydrogenase (short-subunit alcohol dehydrogenase family)
MRALVTGATRGIGRALAEHLMGSGWDVAAVGRDEAALHALARECGPRLTPYVADVTDGGALEAAALASGPLDLVVANAGALTATGAVWEADPDEWWRGVEVNLRGVYLTVRAALPGMLAAGSGRVVLMTSGFGNQPGPHLTQYAASKAAVTVLGESLEGELAGTGVRCFLVSPGMVATDMTRFPEALVRHRPHLAKLAPDAFVPVGRLLGLVDQIATGHLDALAGRYLHATDDQDAVLAAVDPADPRPRTLRMTAAWPSDPHAP